MPFDAHKNFGYSTVATPPAPAASGGSLVVAAGEGADFPAVPFNAVVWPVGALPRSSSAEVVRVTARVGDTLTITRAQEGSAARTILVGDAIADAITAKVLTDIEGKFPVAVADLSAVPKVRVTRSTNQTINNSTVTAVSFDTEDFDNDGMHDNATNPSRLTCVTAGVYLIAGSFRWDVTAGVGTVREAIIGKNGSLTAANRLADSILPPVASKGYGHVLSTIAALIAGDYVELVVFQDRGGVLDIDASSNLPAFSAVRLSA